MILLLSFTSAPLCSQTSNLSSLVDSRTPVAVLMFLFVIEPNRPSFEVAVATQLNYCAQPNDSVVNFCEVRLDAYSAAGLEYVNFDYLLHSLE